MPCFFQAVLYSFIFLLQRLTTLWNICWYKNLYFFLSREMHNCGGFEPSWLKFALCLTHLEWMGRTRSVCPSADFHLTVRTPSRCSVTIVISSVTPPVVMIWRRLVSVVTQWHRSAEWTLLNFKWQQIKVYNA